VAVPVWDAPGVKVMAGHGTAIRESARHRDRITIPVLDMDEWMGCSIIPPEYVPDSAWIFK